MFRGTTTIEMNQATMQEAVQEYLQKRVNEDEATKFKVVKVEAAAQMQVNTFRVVVEEQAKA